MFALHALPGVMCSIDENGGHGISVRGTPDQIHNRTALMAYRMADCMIEARKVKPTEMRGALERTHGKDDDEDGD